MLAHPLIHPNINPIAFHIGPLPVHWYGLMYLLAFILVIVMGRRRIHTQPWLDWTEKDLDDVLTYGVLGVVLGGRLGYVLFYQPHFYFSHPADIVKLWDGGMSFHGGFLGVAFALWLFARGRGKQWLATTDFIAPLVPLGLCAGRIGNFINGELWGRPTTLPWGMIFQGAGDIPRQPSQLYEAALEGVALFFILWFFAKRPRPVGAVSGLFMLGYGIFRFLVEFTREPDAFLGFLALGLTMGQWLSIPLILAGSGLMIWAYRRKS